MILNALRLRLMKNMKNLKVALSHFFCCHACKPASIAHALIKAAQPPPRVVMCLIRGIKRTLIVDCCKGRACTTLKMLKSVCHCKADCAALKLISTMRIRRVYVLLVTHTAQSITYALHAAAAATMTATSINVVIW